MDFPVTVAFKPQFGWSLRTQRLPHWPPTSSLLGSKPKRSSSRINTAEAFIYPTLYFILVALYIFLHWNRSTRNPAKGGFIEGVRPRSPDWKYLYETAWILCPVVVIFAICRGIFLRTTLNRLRASSIGGTGILTSWSTILKLCAANSCNTMMMDRCLIKKKKVRSVVLALRKIAHPCRKAGNSCEWITCNRKINCRQLFFSFCRSISH